MEKIRLDKTNEQELYALLPELKPGTSWGLTADQSPEERCPGDSCFVLNQRNWPDGVLARLRGKLGYRYDWLFKTLFWSGHRYLVFRANAEIRGDRVSSYGYFLMVEDAEFPDNEAVTVQIQGFNRKGFPAYFGFMDHYDEIGTFRVKVPSNKSTTVMYVAFTPDVQQEDRRSAFDIRLDCVWNLRACTATKQMLPILWEHKVDQGMRH